MQRIEINYQMENGREKIRLTIFRVWNVLHNDLLELIQKNKSWAPFLEARHFGAGGCVTIDITTHIALIVIPGLIRNPAFIQAPMLLDAGSSPA